MFGTRGNILFFAIAALNLLAGGAGLTLVYKATLGYHSPVETNRVLQSDEALNKELAQPAPVLYTMNPIIANLAGLPQRAIRVGISIQMLNQNGFEQIMDRAPEVRAAILGIFQKKRYDDIKTIQDKLYLKDQISTAIDHLLKTGIVKGVYFTDFVVE